MLVTKLNIEKNIEKYPTTKLAYLARDKKANELNRKNYYCCCGKLKLGLCVFYYVFCPDTKKLYLF